MIFDSPTTAGRPARNQDASGARERLLQAGLALFARHGFDGATTRMLATNAGVNLGAIPYYFGTKERLYLAVAQHIVEHLLGRAGERIAAAAGVAARPQANQEERLEALVSVLTSLAQVMHAEDTSDDVGRFVLREQMSPTAAFDVLWEGGMSKVHGTAARLLGGLLGRSPNSEEVRLRVSILLGQVLVFRAARALVLRSLGRERYSDAQRARIRRLIAEHTRLVVTGLTQGND